MKCPKCSTEFNSEFCPNCGTRANITDNAAPISGGAPDLDAKPKKKKLSRIKIIGLGAVVLVLLVVGFLIGKGGAKKTEDIARQAAYEFVSELISQSEKQNTQPQKNSGTTNQNAVEQQNADTTSTEPASSEKQEEPTTEKQNLVNGMRKEFKDAMDSYEDFFDKYVSFMKKYSQGSMDLSMLTDYANYMSKYADMMKRFEAWENEDLNDVELAYYIQVNARIQEKLLSVAGIG